MFQRAGSMSFCARHYPLSLLHCNNPIKPIAIQRSRFKHLL